MSKQLLSIIIPVYNASATINRLINSILNQKQYAFNVEIIIVNDGSTDNSAQVLNDLEKKYKNVSVFHQHNQGVCVARNYAISKIKGNYVWMIDADDYIKINAFNTISENIEIGVEVFCFGYDLENQSNSFKTILPQKLHKNEIDGITYLNNNTGGLYLWTHIYNIDFLNKHKIKFTKNIIILEDALFNIKVFSLAKRVKYIYKSLYIYAYQENSIIRSNSLDKIFIKAQSSYTAQKAIMNIRDSFNIDTPQYKAINEVLSYSILGHFNSLLVVNYPYSFISKMYKTYKEEHLLPVKKEKKSLKINLFQWVLNNKFLFLFISRIIAAKNTLRTNQTK